MSKTVPYNSIEYIQNDKELLELIMKDATRYSIIVDIMRSNEPPHTKLASIWDVVEGNVPNGR